MHYASLTDAARALRADETTPVALTELMLKRIAALDGRYRSYATVMGEQALAAARHAADEIAAGRDRGPLHGIPVAVKDLCYTRGTRTMGGLYVRRDFVPEFDATVVARLETAGAVLLGKLNLTEGAMGGYHRDFDIPVNPWDARLWPGTSSSGSGVATAAGLCFASLGSDTGGSIRFPAMANGIVGLKPTYGRVSRHGVLDLAPSLDHVGPMTRTVADAAAVLQTIAGHDPLDPTSLRDSVPDILGVLNGDIAGLVIGYDAGYAAGVDPDLVRSIERALTILADLGARVIDVDMVDVDGIGDAWFQICSYEAARVHAATFPSRRDEYGDYFRDFLSMGVTITDAEYASATTERQRISAALAALLDGVDALVTPSGGVPFELGPEVSYGGADALAPLVERLHMEYTIPADFAGTPALTLPCGVSASGVPHSMQLMGRTLSEPTLCRIGHAYEQATDWHTRHPRIAP